MKLIAVTQRVEVIESYNEHRDALDQRWSEFLLECGCLAVPIANNVKVTKKIFEEVSFSGILLTGGNDLKAYGGNAIERDKTDEFCISYAIENNLPLIGVCRGMQSIINYFGGSLEKVGDHIAVRHEVVGREKNRICVNSYHGWGALRVPIELNILYTAVDGTIESVFHEKYSIHGFMWHPEREDFYREEDIYRFKEIYGV